MASAGMKGLYFWWKLRAYQELHDPTDTGWWGIHDYIPSLAEQRANNQA
jgi:hypothetical protein